MYLFDVSHKSLSVNSSFPLPAFSHTIYSLRKLGLFWRIFHIPFLDGCILVVLIHVFLKSCSISYKRLDLDVALSNTISCADGKLYLCFPTW